MDSLPHSRRVQFCTIFPHDGFEAGAVTDLDKAGWTDRSNRTKRLADGQKKTEQKDQKQTNRQMHNIHTYTCTYTDKQLHRWTVYLVAGGLSSAQSFLLMSLRQAQLWISTKQGGPIGQRDRQTDRKRQDIQKDQKQTDIHTNIQHACMKMHIYRETDT